MVTQAALRRRSTKDDPDGRRRRESTKHIHNSRTDRLFLVVVYGVLLVFLLSVFLPLLNVVASSFSDPLAVNSGQVTFWPVNFSLRGYQKALSDPQIMSGFVNSLFYTGVGTALAVVLTVCIAYPLSRRDFWGRSVISMGIVFTMLFAGGIIPTYLVVRQLGLLNTPLAMILPQACGVWQVIIAMAFFRSTIPDDLYEAAQLDGASDLGFLVRVVLPLSKPLLAVVTLMYAVYSWNSYFDAMIYLQNQGLWPLQLVLRNVLILNQATPSMSATEVLERQQLTELLKYSVMVIASVPLLVVYPFVARHFTQGVMVGAIKG